ncbi:MAG TPA: SDR family oxidoreductase [Polyangia bacterium]|jgi:UDP-glucose 4-epimerase
MARYLVTGGAGFIGSNIVHALVARGESVRVIDNFSTGREANLACVMDAIELIRGDITELETVRRAMQGIEYVLHEAAIPSVPRSVEQPIESDRANVLGTLHVLVAARDAKVRRLVYAASSSAYGETPTLPKVETMATDPLSPYAAQKLAGEHYLRCFYLNYGLETVSLRYFNVFGPRQDPKSHYAAVIPRFVNAYIDGVPATIFGDGEQSRDFCFIENTVEANLLACTAPNAAGRTYNIACGERVSLLQVIDILGDIFGGRIAPKHEPGRAGDIKHSLADITAARQALGYEGRVKFAEGLRRTVEWYRQQRA